MIPNLIAVAGLCISLFHGPVAHSTEAEQGDSSLQLLEQAGSQGHAEALLRLGDLYLGTEGTTADLAKAFAYYQRAADAGSAIGKIRVGEMLVHGRGVAQDVDRGRALLNEVAATSNDVEALVALGNAYSSVDIHPMDTDAAVRAYEKAVDLGDKEALLYLGDLFSGGTLGSVDLPLAYSYYARAAKTGSTTGEIETAAMLVRGEGVPRDVDQGLSRLRALADAGSASALIELGDIHSRGEAGTVDSAAAIEFYKRAAATGSAQALMRLGAIYADGIVARPDGRRAADYYRQAADAGSIEARYALGRGYTEDRFGGVGTAAEGLKILEEFAKAGMPDAVSALSDCYLYGLGVSRNPNRAVAMLEESMRHGNLEAALDLVDMYREGRTDRGMRLIRQNLSLARSYLDKIKGRLSYSRLAYEEGLLDAAGGRRTETYQRIYDDMGILPPSLRSAMVRDLRTVNPNAYVYVVQSQLEKRGSYQGKKSGVLDGSTVRAISEYCAQRGAKDLCRFGPMSGPTAELLSFAF